MATAFKIYGIPYEDLLKDAERVFFKFMQLRWIDGDDGFPMTGTPGWRQTVVPGIHLTLIDCRGPDAGCTTALLPDMVPFWWMDRRGNFPPATMECLRMSLSPNYRDNIFNGGRGPCEIHYENGARYQNFPNGNFEAFHGYDEVVVPVDADNTGVLRNVYGSHRYRGGVRFPPPDE